MIAVVCTPTQDSSILPLGTTVVPSGFDGYKVVSVWSIALSEIVVSPALDRSRFFQSAGVVFAHADLGEPPVGYTGLTLIVEAPAMKRGVFSNGTSMEVGQTNVYELTFR